MPLLGDIPILGHLFKTTSTSKRKRNLMVFLRPKIVRDGVTMNEISHRKYNFIRAQQIRHQQKGETFLDANEQPSMPEWDDALALPPTFEEYILEQNRKEDND